MVARLLIALLLPAAMLWLVDRPGWLQMLDTMVYDSVLPLAAPPPSPDILIIAIDERSLRELGRWPWRRETYARLLEQLAPAAPRAVLLNLFLTEPSPDAGDDEQLARAMDRLPVYLPMLRDSGTASSPGRWPGFLPPLPVFAAHARGVGHAELALDGDGVSRTLYLREGPAGRGQYYVGALMAGYGSAAELEAEPAAIAPGAWKHEQPVRMFFAGARGSYRTVSYASVLRGEVPAALLQGKLLLVGATAHGLGGQVPTPNAGVAALPGIEVHANLIDGLLHGRNVRMPAPLAYAAWTTLPIWLVLLLLVHARRHALVFISGLALSWLLLCVLAMPLLHWWLPPAAPILGMLALYLLWSWRRLESQFVYFRQRARTLDSLPASAFQALAALALPMQAPPANPQQALDRAIARIGRMQTLMDEALQIMPAAVLICDDTGCIGSSNAAAQRLLDETLRATMHAPARPPHGMHLPTLLGSLGGVASEGIEAVGAHWSEDLRREYRTSDGRIFQLEAEAFGTTEAGDRNWIVVLPEMTAEREAQNQREEWRRLLSHDLRSPQMTILSLLSMHRPTESIDVLLHAVRREAERTVSLAEGFMDFVEAGSDDYSMEDTHLGTVLLDARDQVWPYARASQVQIETRISDADELAMHADGVLLTRAIVNLLNNAIRHSAAGGRITLCLAAEPGAGAEEDARAFIAVSDDGEGMSHAQLSSLLNGTRPPRSNDEVTHGSADEPHAPIRRRGMGLGFAVVRTVLRRHGGHIEAASATGAGTTFWISLPLRGSLP
jgi:CHASE2 domain-containing sensor protein/signal transduction histidine kinase